MAWEYLGWLTWPRFETVLLAFLGTGGGAWAGALAAQRISERAELREKHGDEVRRCNEAIELSGAIGNTYLSLKKQHVSDLLKQFEDQRRLAHEAYERMQRTGERENVELGRIDLGKLGVIRVRAPRLETLLTERLSVGGRPIALVGYLLHAIESLNQSIEHRNKLIDQFRDLTVEQQIPLLFGLRVNDNTDNTYADLVRDIARETDDCIVFARQICIDLTEYGERSRAAYMRKYRGLLPRISRANFDEKMNELGLSPNLASYEPLIHSHITMLRPTAGKRWTKRWVGMRQALRWCKRRARSIVPFRKKQK